MHVKNRPSIPRTTIASWRRQILHCGVSELFGKFRKDRQEATQHSNCRRRSCRATSKLSPIHGKIQNKMPLKVPTNNARVQDRLAASKSTASGFDMHSLREHALLLDQSYLTSRTAGRTIFRDAQMQGCRLGSRSVLAACLHPFSESPLALEKECDTPVGPCND